MVYSPSVDGVFCKHWTGYDIKESARGNRGRQPLQYNNERDNESQQRATSVVCTLHRQEQRCQGGLYCLYSSASNTLVR